MALSEGFPPLPGDPGGGTLNYIHGTYVGPTVPSYMDPAGDLGELIVLKVEPVHGKMPDNPFTLRNSIERFINGKIEGAIPEAQGSTYALKVRSRSQIEKLFSMTHLSDGTAIKVTHHSVFNFVRCVISCRDLTKIEDEDEILKCLESQKVTKIRRIYRGIGEQKQPTSTVILTISGTSRPEYIDIGYQRIKTRPYYPAPMLCYQCYHFGHTRLKCKQEIATCGNCGQQHDLEKNVRCPNPAHCPRCQDNSHEIGSRKCPVYIKENTIQHIRVDRGISYPEARRIFEANTRTRSYAGTTAQSKDQTISLLSAKTKFLTDQIAAKNARIKSLEDKISADLSINSNSEFQRLEKLIFDMQAEIKQKDERILALEDALKKGSRMEVVRKHGTIEDLVSKVSILEDTLRKKDKEIHTLRLVSKTVFTSTDHKSAQSNESNSSPKPKRKQAKKDHFTVSSVNAKKTEKEIPDLTVKNTSATLQSSIETENYSLNPNSIENENETPMHSGTKPKLKKVKKSTIKQISGERAKQQKPDSPVMYISDTEDSYMQENNHVYGTIYSDASISSDGPARNEKI